MGSPSQSAIVGRLHAWFESMRVQEGYGGPVSHWWGHSLRYAGPGLDWRYEGIIHGYLTLYETTGADAWLDAASKAGRDLVKGQLATGNYRASGFERNPEFGGTPHEACASGALLRLARVARVSGREWKPFAVTARRNLQWHLDALWREDEATFSDTVGLASFVPNKIASTAEAFLELSRLIDEEPIVEGIVEPAAETLLDLQIRSGEHRGAIHQLWVNEEPGERGDGKFFPLYIARCVPPLLAIAEATGEQRFEAAAVRAGEFLKRVEYSDGSFPQVVYESGDRNEQPRWIAGVGDVLRAYDALAAHGADFDTTATEQWLLSGFDDCGAFRTAQGFFSKRGMGPTLPDVLHVVGWNDKAFRWVTTRVETVTVEHTETDRTVCTFEETEGTFVEDATRIEFVPDSRRGNTYYWDKQSRWARTT